MNFLRATFMPGRAAAPQAPLGERSEILIIGIKPGEIPTYEIMTRLTSGAVTSERSWKDFVDLHDTWRRIYSGLRIRFPKKVGKMDSPGELQAIRGDLENYLQSMSQITALHYDLAEFLSVKANDLKQGFTPQTEDDPFAPKPSDRRAPIVSELAAMGPTGSQIPNPASAPAARLLVRQTQQQRAPTQRAPTQRAPAQRAPTQRPPMQQQPMQQQPMQQQLMQQQPMQQPLLQQRAPTQRPPQTMNGPQPVMGQQSQQMQLLMQQMQQVPTTGYTRAPSRMPGAGAGAVPGASGRMLVGRARTQQGYAQQGIMQPGYAPSGRNRFGPSRLLRGGPGASQYRRREDIL